MPHIKVWNCPRLPEECRGTYAEEPLLDNLIKSLKSACLGVPELWLTARSDVTANFAGDPRFVDTESCAVIEVHDLFEKAERTDEVLQALAAAIGGAFMSWCEDLHLDHRGAEVIIEKMRANAVFWKST